MLERLLVTGAAGGVANLIRPRLSGLSKRFRLTDIRHVVSASDSDEIMVGDLADSAFVDRLVQDCDGVLHLGGVSTEQSFEEIMPAIIVGVYNIYRAAAKCDRPRVIFACSNHVVGAYGTQETITPNEPFLPDSFYGASKVFGEAIAKLFFVKEGVESAIVRIGSCFDQPSDLRMMSTWFSPDDFAALIKSCFEVETLNCPTIFGVSNNARTFWRNTEISHLDWHSEVRAEDLLGSMNEPSMSPEELAAGLMDYHGGTWVKRPLDTG